jgi:hypothetical protein
MEQSYYSPSHGWVALSVMEPADDELHSLLSHDCLKYDTSQKAELRRRN